MAVNKNISESGWFYHAPRKADPNAARVPAPAPSQIPCLSNLASLPDEPPKRNWIRDGDSRYIQLAKQGGRPDLLRMRTPPPRSEQPVGYPRVDWYYDQTARPMPTDTNAPPHEFLLPDYMVHQPYKPKNNPSSGDFAAARTPYAFDKSTVYDRDGNRANDKTVKLPEMRPSGYGVRAEKQQAKQQKHVSYQTNDPSNYSQEPNRCRQDYEGECHALDKPAMSRLLAHGYLRDSENQKKLAEQAQWRDSIKADRQQRFGEHKPSYANSGKKEGHNSKPRGT